MNTRPGIVAGKSETDGKVLIITDRQDEALYKDLVFAEEAIEIYSFNEAPEAIKDCRVDLILLDCNINVDEGLQVLKNNKTSCPSIPNIFITEARREGVVLSAFRAGARDFFRKPVNLPELQETVKGILSFKKSDQEKRAPFLKNFS